MYKIVVDIYGADAGVAPVLEGVAKAIEQGVPIFPVMVGNKEEILSVFSAHNIPSDKYDVIDTDKYITNNDPPTCIFGANDDCSMAMAYAKLKSDPDCVAMLSAGNTGALLVGSICRLGLLPGLKFPALASALPCAGENLVCLVDCGANIDCTANDLVRFAKMGDVFSRSYCGIESPRVGLMNVGREAKKGNALAQEAYGKISELPINFVGNLEGSDLVSGYADVIVTDGFSGNIILKNAEAVGKAAMSIVEKLAGEQNPELCKKICDCLFETFDFNSRGGATFLGPKKTVVKMHGSANVNTTVACLEQIIRLEKANFSGEMAKAMSN